MFLAPRGQRSSDGGGSSRVGDVSRGHCGVDWSAISDMLARAAAAGRPRHEAGTEARMNDGGAQPDLDLDEPADAGRRSGGVPEEAGTEEVHAAQRQETAEDWDLGNQHGPVAHAVQRPGSTDMQWNEKANPVTTLATAPTAMGEKRFSTETLTDPPARRRADHAEARDILARPHPA